MNKRVLLAGVLGAVAMFLWSFVAHDLLPLGVAGMQYIDNEQALLSTMKSTLSAHGMYMFPKMDPKGDMSENEKKIANGPSGLIIYFPTRDFSFPKSLAIEFATELLQALIAAYLLSLTGAGSFGSRLGFFALIGLLAASATNISYWNWYGFSDTYTCAYMFTGWFGYVCAGVVAAAMKVGGSR
jgi:hypothetical protein